MDQIRPETMIETKRLKIYPAARSRMEAFSRARLFVTPCGAHQAPLSMGFSWQ